MADNAVDLTETNGAKLVNTVSVFLALTWIAVVLRTYTRVTLTKSFKLDDWIMLVAQSTFTVYAGFLYTGVKAGIGTHNAAIEDSAIEVLALKWQALAICTYIILMMFIKLSIGVFLLRLAVQTAYIWILRVSLVIIAIWSTVIFFWNIFQCDPVDKQWDYRIKGGRCVDPDQLVSAAYAMTALTVLSDWLYALLPIPMVWNVKMSKQAKATVIVILGLGIFASVATLVRIRFLPDMANTADVLYAGTDAMIWTIIEAGLAIIAASLATIRPLLRAMRVRGFESTGSNSGHSRGKEKCLPPVSAKLPFAYYGLEDLTLTIDPPSPRGEADKRRVYSAQGTANEVASTWRGGSEDEPLRRMHDLEAQHRDGVPSGHGLDGRR